MKKCLKYLFLFCVLIFSAGIAMAQGPYEFTGSNTGQQTANSPGGGTIVYETYLTVPLNQGTSLRHLDYDISWHSQGFSTAACNPYCPSQYGCAKINLYDNTGNFVQTLETIYEYNVNDGANYYNYTGSLDFNVPILSGYEILVELQAQWGWTSYVDAAAITAVTGPLCETLIFVDDFQTSPISPEWSTTSGVLPVPFTYTSITPAHTATLIGEFGNKIIELDIAALPTHTAIRIEFNLYIFDSWDGNAGYDYWKLNIDGTERINTTFDNITWLSTHNQSYPHNYEFVNPVQDGAAITGLDNLNWSPSISSKQHCTSIYNINNIVSHSSNDITISLEGSGLQGSGDESWGIDNVKVYALGIHGCTDPLATNYDANAICDDGSCIIPCVYGCTDPLACNYDPLATCDDGSCDYSWGCMDDSACNYDATALCDDGSCLTDYGCMDTTACNYDASATCDDGSCVFDVSTPITTNACPGMSDGQVNVIADSSNINYDPTAIYHYSLGSSGLVSFNIPIDSLSTGPFVYFPVVDSIICPSVSFTINEYTAMDLQTAVIDSTCDSSYAYVSVSQNIALDTIVDATVYCVSFPSQSLANNIENVVLVGNNSTISNNTAGQSDSYEDYTNLYADVTPGQSYTVSITLSAESSISTGAYSIYPSGAKVYVDWNQNADFTDPGEEIGMIPISGIPHTTSMPMTVPSNAIAGATVMRVVSRWNEDVSITSCNFTTTWFGASEDYSIVISTPTTLTNATYLWSNGDADSITNSLSSGTYTVTVTDNNGCSATDTVSVGQSFQVQLDSLVAVPDPACFGDIVNLTAYPSSALYEYRFMYNDGNGWGGNVISPWGGSNPVPHIIPITQQTSFRVKIRNSIDNSCATNWEVITVPVNPLPSSGPIWHN